MLSSVANVFPFTLQLGTHTLTARRANLYLRPALGVALTVVLSRPTQNQRHLDRSNDGLIVRCAAERSLYGEIPVFSSLPCRCSFSFAPPCTVILTEAAHGLIVSSTAEKPASLPIPLPSQRAVASQTSRPHSDEGRSTARRAQRPIYCLALALAVARSRCKPPKIPSKNPCQAPKPLNSMKTNQI